jgi:hypothetical protein
VIFGSTLSKKIPRFLTAQTTGDYKDGIPGIQALWPDRSESAVYDLSLSGMAISPNHHFSKVKLHESFDFNLRIRGLEDHVLVKARLVRIHPKYLGVIFESMSIEGRLTLDQHTKDRLIVESIKEVRLSSLPREQSGDLWLHGVFDTNVILWLSPETQKIQKALIEYENLVWNFDNGETLLQKSAAAIDESQSYFQNREGLTPGAKVSMGASWLDRLIRTLQKIDENRGDLSPLIQLLRSQRAH